MFGVAPVTLCVQAGTTQPNPKALMNVRFKPHAAMLLECAHAVVTAETEEEHFEAAMSLYCLLTEWDTMDLVLSFMYYMQQAEKDLSDQHKDKFRAEGWVFPEDLENTRDILS